MISIKTSVVLNIYSLHVNEKIFKDPMEFKPERWIEDPSLPLLPYGMGKRTCYGKKFALMLMKTELFYLLKV